MWITLPACNNVLNENIMRQSLHFSWAHSAKRTNLHFHPGKWGEINVKGNKAGHILVEDEPGAKTKS